MNWELDSILEQSITQMAEGKARVESCLLAYPAHADELAPLLLVSEDLLAASKPALSPAAKARIEGRLFEGAVASGLVRRERKPLVLPRITVPRWRPAYSAVAAVVIVVLLLTTTFVGAANALPGSPFYAVKLATEDVWLWVAPARDEPALHLRFAQRRLAEYQELVERGIYDDSVLDDMVTHVEAALDGIEELPPAIAGELLDEVAKVVAEQQRVLTGMLAHLPAGSRLAVEQILGRGVAQVARMEAMRWVMDRNETGTLPEDGLIPVSTWTAEPGQSLEASATLTFSPGPEETEEAPTPTNTGTSGGTEPGGSTSTAPTATSVPTQPSSTPTPGTAVEATPTKKIPPGQLLTPPGLTRKPDP